MREGINQALAIYPEALNHLPQGWRLVPVGQVLESSQYGLNVAADQTGNVPIVGMKDISDGHIDTGALAMVRVNGEERASHTLNRGDILINRTNSYDLVGKVGIYNSDVQAVFASYLVRLHAKRSLVDPWFLNYWLNHSSAQQTIKRIATRAIGQANINPTEFKKYCVVPLPPLAEQSRIVEILRTWDEAIVRTEELVQEKQKLKRVMLDRLVDATTEGLGEGIKLRELCNYLARGSAPDYGNGSSGFPVLNQNAVRWGYIDERKLKWLRPAYADHLKPESWVATGDVVINSTGHGTIGRSYLMREDDGRMLADSHLTIVRADREVLNPSYLVAALESGQGQKAVLRLVTGSTGQAELSPSSLRDLRLRLPSLEVQRKVADLANNLSKEIDKLELMLGKLNKQKSGLMQKLLTGEWRVTSLGRNQDATVPEVGA